MNFTFPRSRSPRSLRTRAAIRAMAVWPSWPQACMAPSFCERYGTSFASWMGRASMSARTMTVLPGRPPRSRPTTPVLATPVATSRPMAFSRSATTEAVRSSWKPSSGWAWRSLRISTASSVIFATSGESSGGFASRRSVFGMLNPSPQKLKAISRPIQITIIRGIARGAGPPRRTAEGALHLNWRARAAIIPDCIRPGYPGSSVWPIFAC